MTWCTLKRPGANEAQDDEATAQYDDCTSTIRLSGYVYLAFLSIPLSLQVGLFNEVCKARAGVNEGVEEVPEGEEGGGRGQTGSVASFARQRVLSSIVKPLKWYPIVFLCASVAYVLWTVSMSPGSEMGTTPLPHTAGTGSALAFSLKGVLNSLVYFCSRQSKRRTKSCWASMCAPCRKQSVRRKGKEWSLPVCPTACLNVSMRQRIVSVFCHPERWRSLFDFNLR